MKRLCVKIAFLRFELYHSIVWWSPHPPSHSNFSTDRDESRCELNIIGIMVAVSNGKAISGLGNPLAAKVIFA
jgi:hypothetical protein